MVRETVRQWALMEFHHGDVSEKEESALLDLLAEMMTPLSSGRDAVAKRVAQKSEIRESLKAARTQNRFSGADVPIELDEAELD
jgi:hypothetical protein